MSRVPSAQLKADAPDSPLSSVLASLNETSRKAQTAYRRGDELRREVETMANRVAHLEAHVQSATNPDRMAHFVREVEGLQKWKAQMVARMGAIIELSNDAIAHAQDVAGRFDAVSRQLTDSHVRQADETRRIAAELADLRRRQAVRTRLANDLGPFVPGDENPT